MAAIITALLSAIAAFIGSWLAARFALDRFYHERIWERRAAAYTAVFDALHDQAKWYSAHLQASMHGREISDDEASKLSAESMAAKSALKRRIFSETWLVSDEFLRRIAKMVDDLGERQGDWPSHLEAGENAVESAIEDLRNIARRELRVPTDRIRLRWFRGTPSQS
jgi:hypothetical protein